MKNRVFVGQTHIFIKNFNGEFLSGGKNKNGQLGTRENQDSEKMENTTLKTVHFPKELKKLKSIACGTSHSLFLSEEGRVFGCGSTYHGELAKDSEENVTQYLEIPFFKDKKVSKIFCRHLGSFFVLENGKLFCCGRNKCYSLGIEYVYAYRPKKIDLNFLKDPKNEQIIDIKGGLVHTLLLSDFGKVYSCGRGTGGELGQSFQIKNSKIFGEIDFPEPTKIIQISTGGTQSHSLLLTENFKVYSFGSNYSRQLGLNHGSSKFSPTLITSLLDKNIRSIRSGGSTSFFISLDNKIYFCGSKFRFKKESNLEKFKENNISVPTEIYCGNNFIDVHCGEGCCYFINKIGEMYSIGRNLDGECCLDTSEKVVSFPTKIKGIQFFDTSGLFHQYPKEVPYDIIIKTESY